jgi:glutamyl-tRNA synthetase
MNITHIIRGDDHLTNAFRQKVIYEAMEWKVPEFAHIPLIHGPDGSKMSKRHGATSVIEYKEMGYLPEAMRNYLLRLGWSHGDSEIISDAQAIEWFNLEKVGKSPARFDFVKLKSVNKHYIKEKDEVELLKLVVEFFDKNLSENEKSRIAKALKFVKERSDVLDELAKNLSVYFDGFKADFDKDSQQIILEKKSLISELQEVFVNLNEWNHDGIKNALMSYAESKSLKIKDFGPALRLVLTFSQASAGGIFDVIEILGKEEVVARIAWATKL